MVKKEENKNSFPAILVVGSVLISIIIGLFVGRTYYEKLKVTNQKLEQRKSVSAALSLKLERLKKLKDQEEDLKEKNKKVLAAIPKDKDVPRLFRQFEDIMTSSGVITDEVKEVSQTELEGGTTETRAIDPNVAKKVGYAYKASPLDYLSIKLALQKFEDALRLLSIEKIEISNEDGQGFKMDLSLTTYERVE